jgi:hypothetical protein
MARERKDHERPQTSCRMLLEPRLPPFQNSGIELSSASFLEHYSWITNNDNHLSMFRQWFSLRKYQARGL